MLGTLKMILDTDEDFKINYNMSSLLHGIIMENVDRTYGDLLHISNLKPFTQHVERKPETGENIWIVNTLNEEAYEKIIKPLSGGFNSFVFKHNKRNIRIAKKELYTTTYGDLIEKCYIQTIPNKIINLKFITPTSFKTFGEYCIYPDLKLIYSSIINKYDNFSNLYSINSEKIAEDLAKRTKIISYKLRTASYSLESVKIPAFMGEATLKVSGPEAMINLSNLLFSYAKWSGIGIKTALGMGAADVFL